MPVPYKIRYFQESTKKYNIEFQSMIARVSSIIFVGVSIKIHQSKDKDMKIIAHRGDATVALENTMEAFEAAVQAGADGFEFDVRLTADHVPVVYHHMMLDTDTENGFVVDYTFAQIQQLRRTVDGVSYKIPSLDDVLDTFCGKTYLEIHVQDYKPETVREIGKRLQPYRQYWDMCEVTSYDSAILLGFQDICAGLTRDFLFRADAWMTDEMAIRLMLEKATLGNASNVHLFAREVTPEVVERFQNAGFGVHTGVVDSLSERDAIQSAGVDRFSAGNIHLFMDTVHGKNSD